LNEELEGARASRVKSKEIPCNACNTGNTCEVQASGEDFSTSEQVYS
jgi:hypothetical protein